MTDRELRNIMEQSAENGRRALFDEYCGYVYAICANKLKTCGSSEDIDECLSDTFAAVFRYLDGASGQDGDLKGIIGTIAKRTAIDYFRRLSSKGETLFLAAGAAMIVLTLTWINLSRLFTGMHSYA